MRAVLLATLLACACSGSESEEFPKDAGSDGSAATGGNAGQGGSSGGGGAAGAGASGGSAGSAASGGAAGAAGTAGAAGSGGSGGFGGPLAGCGAQKSPFMLFTEAQVPALTARMHDGVGADDQALVDVLKRADIRLNQTNQAVLGITDMRLPMVLQDLGFAMYFGATEKRSAYQQRCASMAQYLVDEREPLGFASNGQQINPHVVYALAFAYDTCWADAPKSDPQKAALGTEIEKYLDFMLKDTDFQKLPGFGNYSVNVGAALLMGALALEADGANSALTSQAKTHGSQLIDGVMDSTFTEDGAYHEGVLYSAVSTHALSYAAVARYNYDCTDLFTAPRMERVLEWLAYNILPQGSGRTHPWNDSSTLSNPYRWWDAFPSFALSRFGTWPARFVHDNLVKGQGYGLAWAALFATDVPLTTPSLPLSKLFDNGQYFQRTGWNVGPTSADLHVTFFSGPFFGGHNQEDKNTFTLHGYGSRLLVDTGDSHGPGACADPGSQTEGHNLIVVDVPNDTLGYLGQAKASGSCGTDGKIASSLLSPVADYLHGDAREAYIKNSALNPWPAWNWCAHSYNGGTNGAEQCAHPKAMERANRYFMVMKAGAGLPEYVVLADDTRVDANTANKYRFALHAEKVTGTEAYEWDLTKTPFELSPAAGQSPQAHLDALWVAPPGTTYSKQTYVVDTVDDDNRVLLATATASDPLWLVTLFPYAAGGTRPTMAKLSATSGAASTLTFPGGIKDTVYAGRAGSGVITSAQATGTLRIGVVREHPQADYFALGGVTKLTHKGVLLVDVQGGAANVASDGVTVHVDDPDLSYEIYGPKLTTARSGSAQLPVYRAGDRVRITKQPVPACAAQSGNVCSGSATCTGEWLFASDSDHCCKAACQ
ncbi:MAG: hypothetical protein R3B13_15025 [Polyangiaceae bacterium]